MTGPANWAACWWTRIVLLLGSVVLLTLAFAPISQFYLAWIGLAPWLIVVVGARSWKSAFLWSWLGGTAFFTANMWWMAYISGPGMAALMIYLGLYWACAAVVIRGAGLLDGRRPIVVSVLGIASIWVALEWLRSIVITGLPWLYLGHTQTPARALCQIADITGAYGVSFWVVSVNALVALAWLHRRQLRRVAPAAAVVAGMSFVVLGYGVYRIGQTAVCLSPGPTVAVIQANYPQSNSGEHSETDEETLKFHVEETLAAVEKRQVDLAVWSETMMPPLNRQTLAVVDALTAEDSEHEQRSPRIAYDTIQKLAREHHLAILTGGEYAAGWKEVTRDGEMQWVASDRRNTAYFFDRQGRMDDSVGKRYDKIHLVPWGEFIPFRHTAPWLYRLSVMLGPASYEDSVLQPGAADALTVFQLRDGDRIWHFVTPICFEDIDASLCAAMFRRVGKGGKRADFLVNITNDGWFKANQNAQHLQAAIFRSIENRVWSARSVNTGISGFIDSTGGLHDLVEVRRPGASVAQVMIDSRLSLYTRFGDIFAGLCVAASAGLVLMGWSSRKQRTGSAAKGAL